MTDEKKPAVHAFIYDIILLQPMSISSVCSSITLTFTSVGTFTENQHHHHHHYLKIYQRPTDLIYPRCQTNTIRGYLVSERYVVLMTLGALMKKLYVLFSTSSNRPLYKHFFCF